MEQEVIFKKLERMLKYQAEWAHSYNEARRKRLYEKGKAEKQRVNDKKQQK
jgi:hypothetical protein